MLKMESTVYKFSNMKNREDVVALRWPKACLSCGTDVPDHMHPQHAIIGTFHVDKNTRPGDKRHTQVLLKLPGFFYICEACSLRIDLMTDNPPNGLEKVVENLKDQPWMEFIELEKSGHIKMPAGVFRDKLQKANPAALLKTKKSPMAVLEKRGL